MRYADSLDAPVKDGEGDTDTTLADTIPNPGGEAGFHEVIHADYAAFCARGIMAESGGDIVAVMQYMAISGLGLSDASRALGLDPAKMRSKYPAAKERFRRWVKERL